MILIKKWMCAFFLAGVFCSRSAVGCTIFSAIAPDGQVWNGNNEDGSVGVANFINVFPKAGKGKYGYFTLSYLSPKSGEGGGIQGGMNEMGLTFDFNSIPLVTSFDATSKKPFPLGDAQILPTILSEMSSVQEVIDFFNKYWFQNGFRSAQMHVADRHGKFAIISASGIKVAERGQFLVSTNFDICGKEDSSACWRYPLVTSKLTAQPASLKTMMDICKSTSQSTLYSNIQNLTTGDVWFFSKHDDHGIVKTNINEMLSKGRRSYSFSDLTSLIEKAPVPPATPRTTIDLSDSVKQKYTGEYFNDMVGKFVVTNEKEGIILSYSNSSDHFQPYSPNGFFMPTENVCVEFTTDTTANKLKMSVYQDGFWSFDAWRSNGPE